MGAAFQYAHSDLEVTDEVKRKDVHTNVRTCWGASPFKLFASDMVYQV
jgi:hypothetical protein